MMEPVCPLIAREPAPGTGQGQTRLARVTCVHAPALRQWLSGLSLWVSEGP